MKQKNMLKLDKAVQWKNKRALREGTESETHSVTHSGVSSKCSMENIVYIQGTWYRPM